MSRKEIEEEAKYCERKAEEGDSNSLYAELHELPIPDRLAVAKKIELDQSRKTDPSLPRVEFTQNGDLESWEKKQDNGWLEHRAFVWSDSDNRIREKDTDILRDKNGRITRMCKPDGTGWEYIYDSEGRLQLARATDNNGQTTTYVRGPAANGFIWVASIRGKITKDFSGYGEVDKNGEMRVAGRLVAQ